MAARARATASYHHGDLRVALVRCATELIASEGLAGLSLRRVAARAGVSPAAPYHHFQHKNDLLAAVAAQAFEDLRDRVTAAIARKRTPRTRLEAAAHAYLDFAIGNPSCFRVMSMPELAYVETADGRAKLEAARASFALLMELVADVAGDDVDETTLSQRAITVYATLQGFARLCIDGSFGGEPAERRALQRAVVANAAAMAAAQAAVRAASSRK